MTWIKSLTARQQLNLYYLVERERKKKGKTKNNFRGRKKGGKSVGEQNNELVVVNLPEKIQQNVKIMKKKKKKKKKKKEI